MNIVRLLVLASCLAVTSTWAADNAKATPATSDGNACTWISSIDDWRRLDDRNLVVWVSRNEIYHVELTMPLLDLRTASSIGFVDHNRDGRLCGFGMDEVVVPNSPILGSATIANMNRLDPPAVEALEAQYKVKLVPARKKAKDDAKE